MEIMVCMFGVKCDSNIVLIGLNVMRWQAENPNAKVWYQTRWFEGKELKTDVFVEAVICKVE